MRKEVTTRYVYTTEKLKEMIAADLGISVEELSDLKIEYGNGDNLGRQIQLVYVKKEVEE